MSLLHHSKSSNMVFSNTSNQNEFSTRKNNITSKDQDNYKYRKIFNKNDTGRIKKISKITLTKLRNNTRFKNSEIFYKRELAFNKSIREGRKVFKYQNASLEDMLPRSKSKPNKKLNNSFYLTQYFINAKKNNFFLPKIEKDTEEIKKTKDIVLLKNICHKKEKLKEHKDMEKIFNHSQLIKKDNAINLNIDNENNITNFMSNLREFMVDKFSLNTKKEKFIVLQENKRNKVETTIEKITLLKNSYFEFKYSFLVKFNEYIKKIERQKELEKQKDDKYTKVIYNLRKDVSVLGQKINKIENEIYNFHKWMYLQICVKEKKLILPKCYKIILGDKFQYTSSGVSNFFGFQYSNYDNSANEKNSEKEKKEILKILEFFKNIDSSEIDNFLDSYKRLEYDNLDLLAKCNKLKNITYIYEEEKQKMKKEEEEYQKMHDIEGSISYNELRKINTIKRYEKLSQDKNYLALNKIEKKIKHRMVFNRIKKIFTNLNSFLNYNFENEKTANKNKEISEETLMINVLQKLETLIDIFLQMNRNLNEVSLKEVNDYKNRLKKERKLKRTQEQKINIELKMEKQRKKIIDKAGKLIILPKRKIPVYNLVNKKIYIRKCNSQEKIREDNIYNYLHDLRNDY